MMDEFPIEGLGKMPAFGFCCRPEAAHSQSLQYCSPVSNHTCLAEPVHVCLRSAIKGSTISRVTTAWHAHTWRHPYSLP